jgi:glutathione S-transferase
MARPTLTISSRSYHAGSLQGWLLCRLGGLDVRLDVGGDSGAGDSGAGDADAGTPSTPGWAGTPRLQHGDVEVWGPLAIGEYVHELRPDAGLLSADVAARARCRSVCGEAVTGFANLRSALPMHVGERHRGFRVFSGAEDDIARVEAIWRDCLRRYGGGYLFGSRPGFADAVYAPLCSAFVTYDVTLDAACAAYRDTVMSMPAMQEWLGAAAAEAGRAGDDEEFEAEF